MPRASHQQGHSPYQQQHVPLPGLQQHPEQQQFADGQGTWPLQQTSGVDYLGPLLKALQENSDLRLEQQRRDLTPHQNPQILQNRQNPQNAQNIQNPFSTAFAVHPPQNYKPTPRDPATGASANSVTISAQTLLNTVIWLVVTLLIMAITSVILLSLLLSATARNRAHQGRQIQPFQTQTQMYQGPPFGQGYDSTLRW